MSARFLILLCLACGLAVFWTLRPASTPDDLVVAAQAENKNRGELDDEGNDPSQVNLWARDLPGEQPEIPPEFTVNVEVDRSTGKNRLVFYVTETHGYYAEYFTFNFWHHEAGQVLENPQTQSPLWLGHVANKYIKAGEVLKECIEIVRAEMDQIDGDIGTGENWSAVVSAVRWRAQDPDPLPPLSKFGNCE